MRRPTTGTRPRPARIRPAKSQRRIRRRIELIAKRTRALAPRTGRVRAAVVPHHARPSARRDPRPMNRKIPLAPAEGWSTLGLVILICLTMAWAIDDAAWVLGRPKYLDFLPLAAIGGVLVGVHRRQGRLGPLADLSSSGRSSRRCSLPLIVALLVFPDGASIHDLYPGDLQRRRPGLDRPRDQGPGLDRSSTSTTS